MTVHLLRVAAGFKSVPELRAWHDAMASRGRGHGIVTRNTPKRAAELMDDGSVFWALSGAVRFRQKILTVETHATTDGTKACFIRLIPGLIDVEPVAQRPFQGWRYLEADKAPADLGHVEGVQELPEALREGLRLAGLL